MSDQEFKLDLDAIERDARELRAKTLRAIGEKIAAVFRARPGTAATSA